MPEPNRTGADKWAHEFSGIPDAMRCGSRSAVTEKRLVQRFPYGLTRGMTLSDCGGLASLCAVEVRSLESWLRSMGFYRGLSCLVLAALLLTACAGAASSPSRAAAHIHPRHRVTSPRPEPTPSPTRTRQPAQLSIASSGLGLSLNSDACIEEPPTAGDRHQVVFVDAGHGGIDPGSQGTTTDGVVVYEKDVTLAIELMLAQLLRAEGFTVVLSRTEDSLVAQEPPQDLNSDGTLTPDGVRADLEARIACADSAQARLSSPSSPMDLTIPAPSVRRSSMTPIALSRRAVFSWRRTWSPGSSGNTKATVWTSQTVEWRVTPRTTPPP